MRVILLRRAQRDMLWWRRYYNVVFPEGAEPAFRQFDRIIALLVTNPRLGRPVEGFRMRQISIVNTPYKLIYRVRVDRLEILRIWDMRQRPSRGFREE